MENKEQNTGMSLAVAVSRYPFYSEELDLPKHFNADDLAEAEQKAFVAGEAWQASQPINSVWVSVEDSISFAEYFRNNFDYYDCNANGRLYKWISLRKDGIPAMSMKQIFNDWQNTPKQ